MNRRHIYITESEMGIDTICDFPSNKHAFTHWKFVLRCCSRCPSIFNINQELHNTNKSMCLSTYFYVYKVVSRSKGHGKITFEEKSACGLCVVLHS